MLNVRRNKLKIINIILIFVYIIVVFLMLVFEINERRNEINKCVNNRLFTAASVLKYLLAEDFHDRAVAPGTIGMDEERLNRQRMNDFYRRNGFEWAYTVVEWGGHYYFSAPAVSELEAMERESWYFYPFEEIPQEFKETLITGIPAVMTYRDVWGTHRCAAVPETSPRGNPYISCVEYNISSVDSELRQGVLSSSLRFALVSLIVIPFLFLNIIFNIRIDLMNAELNDYRISLEELVEERTEELMKVRDELQEQAIRDPLTGIYNRRFMTERLEEEMSRHLRSGSTFTLMVLDLDHFKIINDNFGHIAGDRTLQKITKVIGKHLRPHDVFGRFGGDEFIILLPDTDIQRAKTVGEKLIIEIGEAEHEEDSQKVTLSIGAAEYIRGENLNDFLTRADFKMYEAKKKRNCFFS